MATKPFTVDGNIVVDEATLSNSTNSLVLPAGSIITGGGTVLDATNSDTDDLTEGTTNLYYTDARADARAALLVDSAPATLDTLNELAAALGDDPNFATTTANNIATKLPLAGGTMTGDLQLYKATPIITLKRSDNATLPGLSWQGAGGAEAASIKMDGTGGMTNSLVMSTYNGSTMAERLRLMTNAAGGIAVTGTISVTGTVDGVDIAARDAILTSTTTTADAALPKAGGTLTGPLTVQGNGNATVQWGDTTAIGALSFDTNDNPLIRSYTGKDLFFQTNGGNNRMVILSDGNVGIGTSEPAELLHANGSIRLTTDVSTTRRLYALSGTGAYALNSSGGAAIAFHRDASNNDEIAFETHWQGNQHAERMRIDNQGNIGIGTDSPAGKLEVENTSVNYAILGTSNKGHYFESQSDDNTDGFEIYQQHGSTATRNSFIVNDNRTGSKSAAFEVRGNGNVIISNKNKLRFTDAGVDKAVLGIHTGTRLYMGSEGSNSDPRIRFNGETTQAAIEPALPSGATGSGASGYLDLGSSTSGFKDLYLDGGVYLGGTGSANHLDDYEEGTWTPTLTFSGGSGLAYTTQSGSYVKVGTVVTAQFRIELSSLGSSTGGATFGGLPFNATSVGTLYPAFYGLHHDVNSGSGGSTANVLPIGQITRSANYWNYYNADSTTTIGAAYFNNNSVINGTVTFRVT